MAIEPARAACAAHLQGRFAELVALLWARAYGTRPFEREHIDQLAHDAGLDMARYRRDVIATCPAIVDGDQRVLQRFGAGATPTSDVNGHSLSGARPLEEVDALVRRELAKARADVAGGTPREDSYRVWVVEAGLPRLVRKTSFSPRPPAPWVPRALVRSAR